MVTSDAIAATPPPPPANLVANPGFESASNTPWTCAGQCGVDRGIGLARTGANNGWVRNTSGWNDTIAVTPNTTYTVSAWVRTSANNGAGYFGLRTPGGSVVEERHCAALGGYSPLTVTINSGSNSSLVVFAGLWPNGDTWLQIDDVSVVRV